MANSFIANQGTQTNLLVDTTGGTSSSGTLIPVMKIATDAAGTFTTLWGGNVGVSSGTINLGTSVISSGSIAVTAGTVAVNTNGTIASGSIAVTAGTIATLGTMGTLGLVNTVTTVSNISNGSIHVTAGTEVITSGSISVIAGTIASDTIVGGTLNLGTVIGKDANAVAQTGNPISIGGTDSGGTVRTVLVNSAGAMSVSGASSGTFVNLSTGTLNAGTINSDTVVGGTLQNLNFGTVAISDGTTKANVMASGVSNGTGAQNAQLVAGGFAEFSGSATAGTTDLIPSFDVSNYKYASLQTMGTWVGTINLQISNDNSNFIGQSAYLTTSGTGAIANSITTNTIVTFPVHARYVRIRMNAFTSGTAQATLELYNSPSLIFNPQVTSVQSGAWNVIGTINTGSIAITSGTFNAGTFSAGTITAGTINSGTINTGTINVATISAGSLVVTAGTVSTGTINTGTINTGTINSGTFQSNPIPTIGQSTYGTLGTTGASVFGTLAGGTGTGAGTEIFITSVSLSVPTTAGSQVVSVGWGTNAGTTHAGTGRLVSGNFPPGGGIQKQFNPAINSGTNAQLCYFQAGAGTINVDVTYFITPSTL